MKFCCLWQRGGACLAALLLMVGLGGCAEHVICQRQKVSRDYTYVDLARNPSPYIHRGAVGGEHTTFVKVLGFEGERFLVTMEQDGDAGFTVYGEGAGIRRLATATEVTIIADEALFTVELSALSYGDYELTIAKR